MGLFSWLTRIRDRRRAVARVRMALEPTAHDLAVPAPRQIAGAAQRPEGYLWDRVRGARSLKELDALDAHAAKHDYTIEGALRTAIRHQRAAMRARSVHD